MMSYLKNCIIKILRENPGLKAYEIAKQAETDKHSVNSLLFGELTEICVQDKEYKWYLRSDYQSKDQMSAVFRPTELNRLCEYYLSCIGYDDEKGVSVFAKGRYNEHEYFDLDRLVDVNINQQLFSLDGQNLIQLLKKQSSEKVLYLGYPCYLNRVKSQRSNWEGCFLEPLFYVPLTKSWKDGSYEIEDQVPIFNYRALKNITLYDEDRVSQEIYVLEEELGLNNEELPGWEDIVCKLVSIRKEWKWKDIMNPMVLNTKTKISEIKEAGIYNKAVIIMADRSLYTIGLESELKALSKIPEDEYQMTAPGDWLSGNVVGNSDSNLEELLDVFPMNLEQSISISRALNNPLTTITGPPGTGKSQVVANLLVNSFWKDKKVLFASKNNQAVDVVEARVNSLGSKPILSRTGSGDYGDKLANYLIDYTVASSSKKEPQEIELIKQKRNKVLAALNALSEEEERFIAQRNELDKIELSLEILREKISPMQFSDIRSIDLTPTLPLS